MMSFSTEQKNELLTIDILSVFVLKNNT